MLKMDNMAIVVKQPGVVAIAVLQFSSLQQISTTLLEKYRKQSKKVFKLSLCHGVPGDGTTNFIRCLFYSDFLISSLKIVRTFSPAPG